MPATIEASIESDFTSDLPFAAWAGWNDFPAGPTGSRSGKPRTSRRPIRGVLSFMAALLPARTKAAGEPRQVFVAALTRPISAGQKHIVGFWGRPRGDTRTRL